MTTASRRLVAKGAVAVLAAALGASGVMVRTSGAAEAGPVPGTRPAAARAALADPSGGLQPVVNERGHVSRSVSGSSSSTGTLAVDKPAGATVRSAYLATATTGFSDTRLTAGPVLAGSPVPLDNEVPTGIASYNYFAEVTSVVKPLVDAAAAGPVPLSVTEPEPGLIDGEVLVVVFDDPAVLVDQTVTILYGALAPTGDSYGIQLAAPIDLDDPDTRLEMSLGISFSYQGNGTQQYSTVDVNGTRITSAAGGDDDGAAQDGELITVGGTGDSIANPASPAAGPVNDRSDDELYDLRPFVADGDTSIQVGTDNPSLDDNVFLATFAMNPPVTSVSTGADADGDALPDAWEESPGRDLGDGTYDDTLHQLGATSTHKDVFVQLDAEQGAMPSDAALATVTDAFATAPVSNVDGVTGIRLHLVKGATLTAAQSDALRGPDGLPAWSAVYDRYRTSTRLPAFHFVVSTLWNGAYTGLHDGIPGQFAVLDNCGRRPAPGPLTPPTPPRTACGTATADQAANLMHELGHNLGLHHGGAGDLAPGDLENPYKPNYLSVMNYSFAHSGIDGIGVTFSRWGPGDITTLDETALSEPAGVRSLNPGNPVPAGARTAYYCASNGIRRVVPIGAAADWNCTIGIQPAPVAASISYAAAIRTDPSFAFVATKRVLTPHDDWAALVYAGGTIGNPDGELPSTVRRAAPAEQTRAQRAAAGTR